MIMKRDVAQQHRNKTWWGLLFVAALTVLLLASLSGRAPAVTSAGDPAVQAAPARPWTAVGSTGAVDEASLNIYAFGSADIGFKPNSTGNVVVARYNVTNTFDNNANPNRPGWHTLEMGSNAPINTIIEARLFQIKACTVEPVLLCTARNRSSDHPCATCVFPNATIDFTNNLYYVEVSLTRTTGSTAMPRMYTLRVF